MHWRFCRNFTKSSWGILLGHPVYHSPRRLGFVLVWALSGTFVVVGIHQRSALNSNPIETSQRTLILRFHKPELSNCEYKSTLLDCQFAARSSRTILESCWVNALVGSYTQFVLVPVGLHRQPIVIRTHRVLDTVTILADASRWKYHVQAARW